jgi:hypothetical protein
MNLQSDKRSGKTSQRIRTYVYVGCLAVFAVWILISCASVSNGEEPVEDSVVASDIPEEGEPRLPGVEETDRQEDVEPQDEPEESEDAEPSGEAEEQEPEEKQPEPTEPYEVTEELYEKTFSEVEVIIQELNRIIGERDYSGWREYLTDTYIRYHSDPDVLAERSKSPVLRQNDIELESLEDYFQYVVVPSRANVRLDELEFLDENTVHALMRVGGQYALLYRLKRVNGVWKIDMN